MGRKGRGCGERKEENDAGGLARSQARIFLSPSFCASVILSGKTTFHRTMRSPFFLSEFFFEIGIPRSATRVSWPGRTTDGGTATVVVVPSRRVTDRVEPPGEVSASRSGMGRVTMRSESERVKVA